MENVFVLTRTDTLLCLQNLEVIAGTSGDSERFSDINKEIFKRLGLVHSDSEKFFVSNNKLEACF
jgi:hypothetical protein